MLEWAKNGVGIALLPSWLAGDLRVLTARWLQLDPSDGKLFRLDTGTVSTLGHEHDEPVITTWNVPPAP